MYLERPHTPSRYTWRENKYRFAPSVGLHLSLINHRQIMVMTPTASAQHSLHSQKYPPTRTLRVHDVGHCTTW